jgi:hypothetical protein
MCEASKEGAVMIKGAILIGKALVLGGFLWVMAVLFFCL